MVKMEQSERLKKIPPYLFAEINRKIAAAKAAAAEEVELTETAAIDNSTISTASLDKSETIDTEETPAEEPKVNRNVGCKKFFPSVGMTLTVPCE